METQVEKRPLITMRTAILIAVLLHLVIFVLPKSVGSLLFFTRTPEVVSAEPLRFTVERPPQEDQQQEQEKVPAKEEQKAVTPLKTDQEPQSPDPYSEGETNLKRLQTPRSEGQPAASMPATAADVATEEQRDKTTPEWSDEQLQRMEEQRRAEISDRLGEVLKKPLLKEGDIPIIYDQRKPSGADPVDGVIQFDTYDWDYVPYRDLMLLKIYRYWVPQLRGTWQFNMGQAGRTIIRFNILRDGTVVNVQLLDGSGIIQYDQAANYAIVQPYPGKGTAFPPLPEHFPKSSLTVTIGFFVNMELPSRR
jgi:outer membrane biosynthesis protein TonB